ncbi:MAG TPA: glycine zipper family protein [Gammaproteobacteria bacterium]|jgi:uncharacterized protein YcfJ|nr:glycine zipper family protein [Gammaproteobacteria bacterium]
MRIVYFTLVTLLLAGCSSQRIIIDRQGVDMSMYDRDLAECRRYAQEVPVGEEVAKGAVGGAVIGGVLGAIVGDSRTASRVAGAGAVTGGVRGGGRADNEKDRVVKNCLRNRGYQVLN